MIGFQHDVRRVFSEKKTISVKSANPPKYRVCRSQSRFAGLKKTCPALEKYIIFLIISVIKNQCKIHPQSWKNGIHNRNRQKTITGLPFLFKDRFFVDFWGPAGSPRADSRPTFARLSADFRAFVGHLALTLAFWSLRDTRGRFLGLFWVPGDHLGQDSDRFLPRFMPRGCPPKRS